ncbi:hypothetical protein [Winogradskyella aurantiaca]|uniref:hypothetical protein n=1 Tax=Winogradskyella aurantiaca TaxID=2219558 RepID=UPI0013009A7C|nr:hypothetical protein [Winogradskyella aurantiaca]
MIGFPIIAFVLISTKLDLFFNGFIVGLILIACAIVLFSVVLYIVDVLSNDRILEFKGSFSLIVLGALFIWWLVVTPIVFFEEYYHPRDPGYRRLRPLILFFSNIFMYISFSIALLFCKPQNH